MGYIENPKTKDSGILCCIPQSAPCPMKCADCFFQSGRSYLEPLENNLPNIPPPDATHSRIVRINDGNDSNVDRLTVVKTARRFANKFYNTSVPYNLGKFDSPVVLTINPGVATDKKYIRIKNPPANLMFVRFRTNMWNLFLAQEAVTWYSGQKVPIILTFMAYHDQKSIPKHHRDSYEERVRTVNSYWAIKHSSWKYVIGLFTSDPMVYSCGQEGLSSLCKHCGNCLREYFATVERMRGG